MAMGDSRAQVLRVLLAQSGDREALEALLKEVQGPLFAYLRSLVGDQHLAEDLLQDVFVLICRKLVWLREPEVFRGWVYRIASREAIRRLKKRRHREQSIEGLDVLAAADQGEPLVDRVRSIEHLHGLLSSLSPASRVVLALHYVQGLQLEEIATILDLPLGTVKSRLGYGLSVLRSRLSQDGGTSRISEVLS
jgi:RNA polymerase sigma-70 factor (ECF subfamily)